MLKTKSSFKRSLTNIVAASLVGLSSLLPTYNSNAVTERLNIVSNLFNQTSYQDQKLAIERLYPPTGVLASDGVYNDKVRLTWNASSGASGYQSWRNTTDNSLSATQIGNTSQLIYDDTNIVHGVKYYYWVKATNESGRSGFSNSDSGYARVPVILSAPTGVLASDGVYNDKVRLTWNASSGASGYQSWRNTTDNSLSATQIGNTSQLIYDDTNIVHGVKYYYWVKATNEDGGSSFSNLDEGYAKATVKDYDNENKSDLAVYNSGYWSIYSLENGIILNNAGVWGGADWTPVPGDYDGDGKTDFNIYKESTGEWNLLLSSPSYHAVSGGFGGPGFQPIPGDYDGDGKTDFNIYKESTGEWNLLLSSPSYHAVSGGFGGPGFQPIPGDYDGDGKTDLAVYNSGYWSIYSLENGIILNNAGVWGGADWTPID